PRAPRSFPTRRSSDLEAGARRGSADDDPERLTREPPSARVHEEPTAVAPTRVERPHLPEVTRDPGGGLGADSHEPLRLALARADDVPGLQIEVLHAEVEELRGPH